MSLSVPAGPPTSLAINSSELTIGGPMVGLTLSNGSFLLFGVARTKLTTSVVGNRLFYHSAVPGLPAVGISWCIRSDDRGASFSAPVNLDGQPSAPNGPRNPEGTWDRTFPRGQPMQALEISAVETSHNGVLALIRPASSPFMWEARSGSAGRVWEPMRRGDFPLYAAFNSMLRLRSGAIMICGSFPAVSCHVSANDGMDWTLFTIDVSGANVQGSLIELEDDVVLYVAGSGVVLAFGLFQRLKDCAARRYVYGGRAPSAGAPPYGLRSAKLRVQASPVALEAVAH